MNLAKFVSVLEKGHYPFRAYPAASCRELLFPGCAFPSQLPRTMDVLARTCRELGMGVAYDCCGKPLEDWGEKGRAARVMDGLRARLGRLGCERLVLVCPNCLGYLRPVLAAEGIACVSVYQALAERGFVPRGAFEPGLLFVPCPDRAARELEGQIRRLADLSQVETMHRTPCCGLRAEVAARGPEFSRTMGARVLEAARERTLYTYCASCAGQFARLGRPDPRHVLSVMLGMDECPDAGRALANRARRRFDRALGPLRSPEPLGCAARRAPAGLGEGA